MAITGWVEIADLVPADWTSKELAKLKEIISKDNVKDLSKSKKDKFDALAAKKKQTNLDVVDQTKKDDFVDDNALDKRVEEEFDKYLLDQWLTKSWAKETLTKIRNWNMTALQNDFNAYVQGLKNDPELIKYMQLLEDAEIKEIGKSFSFELESLSQDILSSIDPIIASPVSTPDNQNQQNKTPETWDKDNTYNYKPEDFALTEGGEQNRIERDYDDIVAGGENPELINIFKKGNLWQHMDEVLNMGKDKDRIFKINLSAQNGLAGLALYIQEQWLRDKVKNFWWTPAKFFKEVVPWFDYKRSGWLDNEKAKVFSILRTAADDFTQDKDWKRVADENTLGDSLMDFAEEAKSYGSDYEKRMEQWLNFKAAVSWANEKSILPILCDFNGDGKLGVKYFDYQKRKEHQREWKANYQGKLPYNWKELRKKDRELHKAQVKDKKEAGKNIENQGDVGTIFGPQLYDAIQTASGVLDVKIKNGDEQIIEKFGNIPGENIVIYHILQQVEIFTTDVKVKNAMIALLKDQSKKDSQDIDPKNCSAANLLKLCQEYEEFQPLFAKAIETINGSPNDVAPDLVDSLVGIDRIPDTQYPTFKEKLDDPYCTLWNKNAAVQKFIKEKGTEWFVQMKQWVMTLFDNVNISAMLNDSPKLISLGISKSRDVNKKKHELENSFIKTLVGALGAVTFNPAKFTIWLDFGGSGTTKNLKNNRAWNAGIDFTLGTTIINIHVWWEYARQFNYANIVTSNLSDLGSAHYGGVEWWASEIFVWFVPAVTTIEWGIAYKNDPKAAIEQMYKQYNDVSKEIFDIKSIDFKNMDSADKLKQTLTIRYADMYKKFSTGTTKKDTLMAKFLDNNKQFFETNIDQISRYFGTKKIFEAVKASKEPSKAMDTILNIFQDGLTNAWRETMYESLAGRISVSKIGIGVGVSFIANTIPLIYPKISLKIKHWRNSYIPVEAQKNLDASLMYSSGISAGLDTFLPDPPTVKAYGEFIEAIYNIKAYDETKKEYVSLIKTETTPEWHLKISYTWTKAQRITDILDVRVKVKQSVLDNVKVSDDEKSLIIGDVGGITAYTQSDGLGKRCFLILWWTTMTNTCRLDQDDLIKHKIGLPKSAMTFTAKPGEYQEWSQTELQTNVIDKIVGEPKEDTDKIKAEIKTFFDKDGKLITPTGKDVTWEWCALWDKLTAGTLTVTQKIDGKYIVKLVKTATDDTLQIKYIQESTYQEFLKDDKNRNNRVPLSTFSNLFEYDPNSDLAKAEKEITALYADLMNLEKKDPVAYAQFLWDATKTSDGEIGDNELTHAITNLEKLLKDNTKFDTITSLLGTKTDRATKSYIIDRFKQVLAKEKQYSGKKISTILWWRGDAWFSMTGPSGEKLPSALIHEMKGIRTWWNKDDDVYSENPTIDKTLIGYTAFYRNISGNQYENKKFSLTWLGSTTYQKSGPITNNVDSAKNWFLNNFTKQRPEFELLASQLTKQFSAKWISISMFETGKPLNDRSNNLWKLLNWEEVSVDNWTKKVKIDLSWKFYLLGDCCNESIWAAIGGISIRTPKENGSTWIRSAEAKPEAKYTSSTQIAGRNLSSGMKVGSYGEEMWLNLSVVPTEQKWWSRTWAGVETQEDSHTWVGVETQEQEQSNTNNGVDVGW